MGSSAKKKKEKKKDFQKTKLKVGKAAPNAANSTNTSFKAKRILINQEIHIAAPSSSEQILHHVSLLSSRTDSQRRESLAYLIPILHDKRNVDNFPISIKDLLDKLMPLLLDSSAGVRSEFLKTFQTLPSQVVSDYVDTVLLFIRAGMTHLSVEVQRVAHDTLAYALTVSAKDIVSASGGWTKTLQSFEANLGFKNSSATDGWSINKTGFKQDAKSVARTLQVLEKFLTAGLQTAFTEQDPHDLTDEFPLWDMTYHRISTKSNPYGYLHLFGSPPDNDSRQLDDRSERIEVFKERFRLKYVSSLERARGEGGDVGRAAGQMLKVINSTCTED